eukprot:Phypoly_transcript_25276.p1 GENE.Phypoly_transcript_25276~~Phypoly_transcript_25276.p1  ORF type:complete len:123 (+),score=22.53 Phypoly_transcript_25276:94-462(+)
MNVTGKMGGIRWCNWLMKLKIKVENKAVMKCPDSKKAGMSDHILNKCNFATKMGRQQGRAEVRTDDEVWKGDWILTTNRRPEAGEEEANESHSIVKIHISKIQREGKWNESHTWNVVMSDSI